VTRPDEECEREQRTFVNLLAAILLLLLAMAAIWLIRSLDERRRLELCVESNRRGCLGRFDAVAQ
jgi:hypothetical protein